MQTSATMMDNLGQEWMLRGCADRYQMVFTQLKTDEFMQAVMTDQHNYVLRKGINLQQKLGPNSASWPH